MELTTAQKVQLKADVLANSDATALYNIGNLQGLADLYNAPASPAFTVWKSNVTIIATGQAFNGAEWAGMTTANHTRLQTVAQYLSSYNAGLPDIRAMFNDIWSGAGGTTTRANLLVLWKRLATRAEKLFASTAGGNGADATPATLTFEGALSYTVFIGL